MASIVPLPRSSCDGSAARWYENELGWAALEGSPVLLLTGLHFDVLELPADVGAAVLRRTGAAGPVVLMGRRMRFLVAAGSAEELPGLLDWLQWGGIALDLTAIGAGGLMTAPPPPGWPGSRGAAVWLRPPVPGRKVEPTLPALAPFGLSAGTGGGISPDLVRLVDTVATECHRARLLRTNTPRTNTQPLAFS
ncbi:SCO3374 family protein [Streptomyces sp. SLBN-118]|uniref:SCO3374 family protein n=1 Tax=Streptomyces sp. SLBN-118 TaxID=2768454 RepID=UPI001153CC3B|nr:SCO3374 family protein [Streptomyces sp. SLBN-118]